jgi:hypothetical protein
MTAKRTRQKPAPVLPPADPSEPFVLRPLTELDEYGLPVSGGDMLDLPDDGGAVVGADHTRI